MAARQKPVGNPPRAAPTPTPRKLLGAQSNRANQGKQPPIQALQTDQGMKIEKGLTQGMQGGQGQTQGTTDLNTPTPNASEAMQPPPTTVIVGPRPNGPSQGPEPPPKQPTPSRAPPKSQWRGNKNPYWFIAITRKNAKSQRANKPRHGQVLYTYNSPNIPLSETLFESQLQIFIYKIEKLNGNLKMYTPIPQNGVHREIKLPKSLNAQDNPAT